MNTSLPPEPRKLEFKHLSGGDRELHEEWRADCGIQPALYVGEEATLAKLSEQTNLTPRELLDRTADDLADKYRQKSGA